MYKKFAIIFLVILLIGTGENLFAQEKTAGTKGNWISGELGERLMGIIPMSSIGVRYERMLSSNLSLGVNVYEEFINFYPLWCNIEASFRWYPWGKTFFADTALGCFVGPVTFLFPSFGMTITPEIGWKIDLGNAGGFYLEPGIAGKLVILESFSRVLPISPKIYFGMGYAFGTGSTANARVLSRPLTDEKTSAVQAAESESSSVMTADSNLRQEASSNDQLVATTPVVTALPQGAVPDNMVWIPEGTFTIGSPTNESGRRVHEGPQQQLTVGSFAIGKYPVTQNEYQAVMEKNPSHFKGNNLPVEMVSWYDAVNYCNKLSEKEGLTSAYTIKGTNVTLNESANGYRLPTEAEWEYACRAGTTTTYNTGASVSNDTGWYRNNSGNKTHEVGQKPPNAWGLYDMHGNVWEWCWDYWGGSRAMRGGAWNSDSQHIRSTSRRTEGVIYPSNTNNFVGFRVVLPVAAVKP